jgi:tocopherol O-methyltransferase
MTPPSPPEPPPPPELQGPGAEPTEDEPTVQPCPEQAAAAISAATGCAPEKIPRMLVRARVIEYYRECWHERLWGGYHERSRAMHAGLYAGAGDDPEEARLRLDEHLAAVAGLGDGPARLLDAGCGIGGTAIHLARRHPGLRVTGVDVSGEQVRFGQQLADQAGLRDRVLLLERDYLDTGLAGGSVEVVLAIDSLSHCADRPAFAREALRLLAPDGCLVVSGACRSGRPLDALEAHDYETLLRGFALADCFARPPEEVFCAAGFVEPWLEDLTERVLPGLARASARASALLENVRLPPLRHGHEQACVALYALFQSGALRYLAFRARKPGGAVEPR